MGFLRRAKQKVQQKALSVVLRRQLARLPEQERAALELLIERHPKLFEAIAQDVQTKLDKGVDQFYALAGAFQKYRKELQQALMTVEREKDKETS